MKANNTIKIFISHSHGDKPVAEALVDLIEDCCGIDAAEIFCSSVEGLGAQNVGFEENTGVLNRAVHMRLRRKIDHDIRLLLLKELFHRFPVANVGFDKAEIRLVHHARKRREIAGISELIQAHNAVLRIFF